MKRSASDSLRFLFLLILLGEWFAFLGTNIRNLKINSQIDLGTLLLISLTAALSGYLIWSLKQAEISKCHKRIGALVWTVWFLFLLGCLFFNLTSPTLPGETFYPLSQLARFSGWFYLFPVTYLVFLGLIKIFPPNTKLAVIYSLFHGLTFLAFKTNNAGELAFPLEADQFPVFWQLTICIVIAALIAFLSSKFGKKMEFRVILFVLIWVSAGLFWATAPIGKDYYSSQSTPPAYRVMPESDARMYDYEASRIAFGLGNSVNLSSRGNLLYFYAFLKSMIGLDTQSLMTAQAFLLGIIPALIFLIGCQLGSQLTGFLAALLVIVKEGNAIVSDFTILHPKSLMTEPLMQVGVLLMAVWLIYTLKSRPSAFNWFIFGGLGGFFINVRPNIAALLVIPFVLWLIQYFNKPSRIFKYFFVFLMGFMIAVSPIVVRNLVTGNNPFFFSAKFGILTERLNLPAQAGNFFSEKNYDLDRKARQYNGNFNKGDDPVQPITMSSVALGFSRLVTHSLHIAPQYLPIELFADEFETQPDFLISPQRAIHFLTIFINLLLILAGIRALATKEPIVAFVPLIIFLFYLPSIFLSSNVHTRHMAPIENLSLVYYAGALVSLTRFIPITNHQLEDRPNLPKGANRWLVSIGFIVALALPLVEFSAPRAVFENITAENIATISAETSTLLARSGMKPDELTDFLKQNSGAELVRGRILYPQYKTDKLFNRILNTPLPHLEFRLMDNYELTLAYLPLKPMERKIQNGEEVIFLACSGISGNKTLIGLRLLLVEDLVVLEQDGLILPLDCSNVSP